MDWFFIGSSSRIVGAYGIRNAFPLQTVKKAPIPRRDGVTSRREDGKEGLERDPHTCPILSQ
jgi:hypothetical protein